MLTPEERELVNKAMATTRRADELRATAEEARRLFEQATLAFKNAKQYHDDIERIIAEKTICFPWLADALAAYHEAADIDVAEYLANRKRRAFKAADAIREKAAELRTLRRERNLYRNRTKYYEALFPHLAEYVDDDIDELVRKDAARHEVQDSDDPVDKMLKNWLPPAEYQKLSQSQRNQRALDLWKKSGVKSNWEIGLDFERYIGYLLENEGFAVEYSGALDGVQDMGRDLIAEKDGEYLVVQCKYWASHRTIHEKHVFQLFGSITQLKLRLKNEQRRRGKELFRRGAPRITGRLVTTASASEVARDVARELKIVLQEKVVFNREYPMIKCNIQQGTNDRIYHLPFDQQYDRVRIERGKQECYVATVAEAEALGFRRAFKYRGPMG